MEAQELRIALYVCIFVLSVSGNSLVALTIAQNRRMRTLTNVLLMNLSVADLLHDLEPDLDPDLDLDFDI